MKLNEAILNWGNEVLNDVNFQHLYKDELGKIINKGVADEEEYNLLRVIWNEWVKEEN